MDSTNYLFPLKTYIHLSLFAHDSYNTYIAIVVLGLNKQSPLCIGMQNDTAHGLVREIKKIYKNKYSFFLLIFDILIFSKNPHP